MAGRYGSSSVTVTIEDAPGGTARAITPYLLDGLDPQLEAVITEITALGASWQSHCPTGVKFVAAMTWTLIWDTTASVGPHIVFVAPDDGPQDDGRQVVITFGDSKTLTGDVRLVSYQVNPTTTDIHKAVVVLQPTGTWTYA